MPGNSGKKLKKKTAVTEAAKSEWAQEEKDGRSRLYTETRADLLARQMSNSEKFDGAILAVSTAALGFTLNLATEVAATGSTRAGRSAAQMWLASLWLVFGLAILSTILSFIFSQWAIKRQLAYAEEYYLNGKKDYLEKRNTPACVTEILNYCAACLFAIGMIGTVVFFVLR